MSLDLRFWVGRRIMETMRRLFPVLGFLLAAAACGPGGGGGGGPELTLEEALDIGLKEGTAHFDHGGFVPVLALVDPTEQTVDYEALAGDQSALDAYLAELAAADLTTLGRDEQLALLINTYNACTLKLIAENYPLGSIMDLEEPFKQERCVVAGYTLSLDGIEHEVIRPRFKDPRIHFAVNCAAVGCPKLQPVPYDGETLDAQLAAAADEALSHPKHVRVNDGTLEVTQLFEWYGEDFVTDGWKGAAASIPLYVKAHTDPQTASFIESKGDAPPVAFIPYDWTLNDVK